MLLSLSCQLCQTILIAIARVKQEQRIEVITFLEAFLCKGKSSTTQSNVSNLAPLFIRLLLFSNLLCYLYVVETDSQLKLVV